MRRRARAGDRNLSVLRRVWALVWSVPGCKGHSYRLPIVSTVSAELAGLVVRLSKFTISPTTRHVSVLRCQKTELQTT